MPQWVMSRGPVARKLVPGMKAVASSTTVPINNRKASSAMEKVKSEGTGVMTGIPSTGSGTATGSGTVSDFDMPPVVMATKS